MGDCNGDECSGDDVELWSIEHGRIDLVLSRMELKHERLSQGLV